MGANFAEKPRCTKRRVMLAHVGGLGTYRQLASIGEIGMFLAPLALRSSGYADYVSAFAQRAFTILDSGALEVAMGTERGAVCDRDFLEIGVALGVHEMVAPDCPDDPRGSTMRTLCFVRKWHRVPESERPQLMVVPHGRDLSEWLANAARIMRRVARCTLGIPRLLAQRTGKGDPAFRVFLAETLSKAFNGISIHLLGAGAEFMKEYPFIASARHIRSQDSTFLHRYGTTGLDPNEHYAPPVILSEVRTPPGFHVRVMRVQRDLDAIAKG